MTCLRALRRSLADLLDPSRLAETRELREEAVQAKQEAERASARMLQLRVDHSAALSVLLAELDEVRSDLAMWLGRGLDQPAREEER